MKSSLLKGIEECMDTCWHTACKKEIMGPMTIEIAPWSE